MEIIFIPFKGPIQNRKLTNEQHCGNLKIRKVSQIWNILLTLLGMDIEYRQLFLLKVWRMWRTFNAVFFYRHFRLFEPQLNYFETYEIDKKLN
jgi:hypothetical protein